MSNSIENSETLLRLLCSPQYYNEELNIVNPDAFDLRMLPSGKPESFVSLGRKKYLVTDEEFNKYIDLGRRIHCLYQPQQTSLLHTENLIARMPERYIR